MAIFLTQFEVTIMSPNPKKMKIWNEDTPLHAKGAAHISNMAPTWAKDMFNELTSSGLSPEEAFKKMDTSQFFDKSWIVK